MMDAPLAYRWLYSRGTAAALVLSSGAVLAVSQTHVIRDWLATLHPSWSVPWLWVNAAGFELVVLAVGLVLATTGQRSLWVMEAFLILVSCGAALDSALAAGVAVPRAVLGGLMPLQYLAAVLAGHRLAGQGQARTAEPHAAVSSQWIAGQDTAQSVTTTSGSSNAGPRTARTARTSTALTPERYAVLAAEHVPPGTSPTRADAIVADIVGTSTKTAQRARLAAGLQ